MGLSTKLDSIPVGLTCYMPTSLTNSQPPPLMSIESQAWENIINGSAFSSFVCRTSKQLLDSIEKVNLGFQSNDMMIAMYVLLYILVHICTYVAILCIAWAKYRSMMCQNPLLRSLWPSYFLLSYFWSWLRVLDRNVYKCNAKNNAFKNRYKYVAVTLQKWRL